MFQFLLAARDHAAAGMIVSRHSLLWMELDVVIERGGTIGLVQCYSEAFKPAVADVSEHVQAVGNALAQVPRLLRWNLLPHRLGVYLV